jgi:hypothetical protein
LHQTVPFEDILKSRQIYRGLFLESLNPRQILESSDAYGDRHQMFRPQASNRDDVDFYFDRPIEGFFVEKVCNWKELNRPPFNYVANIGSLCVSISANAFSKGPSKIKPDGRLSKWAIETWMSRSSVRVGSIGDLMQQSACVNRVNAEYLKCIPGCH